MRINSERLWDYIFNIVTNKNAIFKVYYDGRYVTEILWNGEDFEWKSGTFTSGAFFNPLYDFEIIEENKKIENIGYQNNADGTFWLNHKKYNSEPIKILASKLEELIDAVNELKDSDN